MESRVTLSENEKPAPGIPVALDTEFVDLEKAEIDVKADGSQEIVRPSKSGLARVSVLRGSGVREGVPFIDDYITIKEPVLGQAGSSGDMTGMEGGQMPEHTSRDDKSPT